MLHKKDNLSDLAQSLEDQQKPTAPQQPQTQSGQVVGQDGQSITLAPRSNNIVRK